MVLDDAHTIARPKRWTISYADELIGSEMNGELVRELMDGPLRKLAEDKDRFPEDLPLADILCFDTRILTYRKGEVILRQGDYGDSAFVILKGSVQVLLQSLPARALGRRESEGPGLLRAVARIFKRRSPYPEARKKSRRPDAERGLGQIVHLQDFPDFLLGGSGTKIDPDTIETMSFKGDQSGEVFGELAALSRTPRTATVLAAEDGARLLEIRWQGLRDIRKFSPQWKRMIDERYRKTSLLTHLRNAPYTRNLGRNRQYQDPDARDNPDAKLLSELGLVARQTLFYSYGEFSWQASFKQMAEKSAHEGEPVIVKQGSIASELILIRSGFVRVTRRYNHGEKTVAYLGKGQAFGLVELYHNYKEKRESDDQSPFPYQHSLRAVGYVDTLAIPAPVVESYVIPKLKRREIRQLDSEVKALTENSDAPVFQLEANADSKLLEFLVEQRAINGSAAMFIDLDRCTRCDDCVRACAATHDDNPRFVRHGHDEEGLQLTHACMHCVDPVCMIGCPTGAIHRDPSGNQVVINEYTCIGCATCADNCPYDNIQMVGIRDRNGDFVLGTRLDEKAGYVRKSPAEEPVRKATKCDLCVDQPSGPACVNACPHDALIRADMGNPSSFLRWLNDR